MPGRTDTPSTNYSTSVYHSALELPQSVWDTFQAYPADSNIMYAHATQEYTSPSSGNSIWIVVKHIDSKTSPIQFIASCTEDEIHRYPIFIFSTLSPSKLGRSSLSSPIRNILRALLVSIPIERVFSVFAPTVITEVFAEEWSATTLIDIVQEPYYDATFSFCTSSTLSARPAALTEGYDWRLSAATEADIPAIAELCYDFASECAPFIHSQDSAMHEATHLVRSHHVWVHHIRRSGAAEPWEIASVCAVTRATSEVAAITKVYTNRRWRRLGCAERLTWQVTRDQLKTHERVVLYVGHDNSAARVYRRLGFQGLDDEHKRPKGVSNWRELGFDQKVVELGFW